ncbi:NAD(P)/FAD-dependent oxidoreductase [Actinotalea ferrariae]|uniref:NAD(P)/FAD-dependent oxidoreductase n=1 Tax=Actinotalea ferrariae TaxID=1386098 RepID=UPI001C8B6C27|nr:NAD(P)/FAD-dependent oxidoreductase [Actinotalea ferrariae]MBX9245016.1 NAD(P)/FAD-dependent oxidoreductase [Actinotalea ferrariae]
MNETRSESTARAPRPRKVPRIVILGGGYVGFYTALRLRRRLGKREAAIVVVDPRSYMTYQPFLPEAAAGSLEPRHVVVSHRRELEGVDVLTGRVTDIHHADRRIAIAPVEGQPYEITYDHLVVALGSVARTLPIPGLAEQAMGFKQVEEAIALRNHVLTKLDIAASTWDADLRRRLLTFTFVGGGFAGIEAIAEVEDMAKDALRFYDGISAEDLRFVMIEGSARILPELGEEMGGYALEQLRKRGIEVHLSTFLSSCVDGHVVTSTGVEFDSETIVWTAGVKANPVLEQSDLPLDRMGRVTALPTLQVATEDGTVVDGAWTAGDCAAVPDLANPGKFCSPSAQHAVRQARHLGDNLAKALRSAPVEEYKHKHVGTVASLGLGKGVAQVYGVKLRGWPAWFMHRTYHMAQMPTFNRKVRIVLDWTLALFFHRELVALGRLHDPRADFRDASAPRAKVAQKPGDKGERAGSPAAAGVVGAAKR